MKKFNKKLKRDVEGVEETVIKIFESYSWPGNVRELENIIERIMVLEKDNSLLGGAYLPQKLIAKNNAFVFRSSDKKQSYHKGLGEAVDEFERTYIFAALEACAWNQSKTARKLKIRRNTLAQKIKKLEIEKS